MASVNPYQPPQSTFERDFKVKGKTAYRDGGHLIVRKGFRSPQICVVTGKPVERGTRDESIMLRSSKISNLTSGFIAAVTFTILIVFLAIGLEQFLSLASLSPISVIILIVVISLVFTFLFKPSGGVFTVYCCPAVARKRKRMRFIYGLLSVIAVIIYLTLGWLELDSAQIIVMCSGVVISNFIRLKKLLKSLGREGEYERYEGAHIDFLNALPDAMELEQKP